MSIRPVLRKRRLPCRAESPKVTVHGQTTFVGICELSPNHLDYHQATIIVPIGGIDTSFTFGWKRASE